MKKVIIVGHANAIHLLNFINIVLLKNKKKFEIHVINFNSDTETINDENLWFYKEHNIKIIDFNKNIKNKKLRLVEFLIRIMLFIFKEKQYDYCFMNYVSKGKAMIGNLIKYKVKNMIAIGWGSDILRNEELKDKVFLKFYNNCYKVVVPNMNTEMIFNEKTNSIYKEKTITIQFPQRIIADMNQIKKNLNICEVKNQFHLPLDKFIVVCGHSATRAEQYEKMIAELDKCSQEVLDKCFFAFFMTYGEDDIKDYQNEIENILNSTKMNYKIFKKYIPHEELLKMHFASDVHITTIKTDAFSCFLQEELYAGATVIYGEWLNYYEIENSNFNVFSLEKFDDLSIKLGEIVNDMDNIKFLNEHNIEGIFNLESEDSIRNEWENKIFE